MNDNSAPTEGLNTMPPVLDELADPLEADWFSDEADFNVSREMESMSREARSRLSVGDEVEVYVVNPEDRDGNIILSIARAEEEIDWRWAESLLESQEVLEGEISGYNKGGLLVQMRRVRGFVPASQLDNIRRDIRYGSERWAHMVGEQIQAKVIEVDRSRNRLILSERAAMKEWREAQKDRLLEELQEGEVRDGRVINLADFGAFVDLGGADGLVHLSELSWKRVAHPREVVNVGDEVKVYVLNVDRERRRIGLSLKRLEPDPWMTIEQTFQVGTLVEGTVTKLTKFGAFARLTGLDDIEGLIHISELSEEHIEHPSEVVSEGQMVTMRVIRIEAQRRRLGLSIKRVDSDEYADADWSDAAVSDTWSSDEESE
jgi:small subunit ribosomal protein S1